MTRFESTLPRPPVSLSLLPVVPLAFFSAYSPPIFFGSLLGTWERRCPGVAPETADPARAVATGWEPASGALKWAPKQKMLQLCFCPSCCTSFHVGLYPVSGCTTWLVLLFLLGPKCILYALLKRKYSLQYSIEYLYSFVVTQNKIR